jgi:hypothetical protein
MFCLAGFTDVERLINSAAKDIHKIRNRCGTSSVDEAQRSLAPNTPWQEKWEMTSATRIDMRTHLISWLY